MEEKKRNLTACGFQPRLMFQHRHRLKPVSARLKPDKTGSNPNLFEQV